MIDKRTFYVGSQFGPDHSQPSRFHIGRLAAFNAAMKQGDPCTVYRYDGRRKHWELIVDRSMRGQSMRPLHANLSIVLGVVYLQPMQREVPKRGRPGRPCSYRWAPGYVVPTPNGTHEYPPLARNEAISRAREIFGNDVIVKVNK